MSKSLFWRNWGGVGLGGYPTGAETKPKILISDLKYRWGSCTPKDNLNFNWRLIKAPMFVIDYVIVHELTHLMESNHTAQFWNIIEAQLPDSQKAKDWLKEHGAIIEESF